MHNMAKVPISPERIHSTTLTGQPKSDIFKDLQQQHSGASCHFVEDKLGTLEKVSTLGPWLSLTPCLQPDIFPADCFASVGPCTLYRVVI